MSRSVFLPVFLTIAMSSLPSTAEGCFVEPDPQAIVGLGLSAIETDVRLYTYGSGDEIECVATLSLRLSDLPSRSLIPRPREIAAEIVPAVRSFDAKRCTVTVWVTDDTPAADVSDAPDLCWTGTYRYDGAFWRTETEGAPCPGFTPEDA